MSISAAHIARFQATVRDMVADKGKNHKSMPKKRSGKGHCTKKAYRTDGGEAYSKTLRKREARLQARKRGHATSVNSSDQGGKEYTMPGSLR